MSAAPATIATPPTFPARRAAGVFILCALLTIALGLPLALKLDRPPATPRLTIIGAADGLSLLLEGAGGGRLLLGGGAAQADLPAALGRHLPPWDGVVDLLLIVDRRDLPGATELVRRGRVRAVVTVGLGDGPGPAALAALRDTCAARGVPLRALVAAERIALGRDGGITLDVTPPATPEDAAAAILRAGPLHAAIITGPVPTADPLLGAIVLRANQEPYRAALVTEPRLVIAPAPPELPGLPLPAGGQLLVVGPGERATLTIEGGALRLRGAGLAPLDAAAQRR